MGAAFAPIGAALGPVGLVAGLAGGVLSAYGAYSGMEAQSANAAYQAQVARNNAIIAGRNAEMETQSGEIGAANQGLKTRAALGATLAGEGASGIDVNSGSFVGARKAEAEAGTLDALTIRSDAAKKAYAYQTQATGYQAQSQLDTMMSSEAADAAPIAGLGSLLSSASSVGGSYYKYLQTVGTPKSAMPAGYDPNKLSALY